MNEQLLDNVLRDHDAFALLRDEGLCGDAQSLAFARRCRDEAAAASEGLSLEEALESWAPARKIRDWFVEFLAPFALAQYAPASLGAAEAVQATNREYLPELGGHLRLAVTEDEEGAGLLARIWLEDNEGAPPFADLELRGVLEPAVGDQQREVCVTSGPDNELTLAIDPAHSRCLIFDLFEGGRPLARNLQIAFAGSPSQPLA
ncbi:hypothetical protein ACFL34_00640 [Candidatus Sumerlaeota bacterium]